MDERPPGLGGILGNLEYRYLTEFQSHEPEFDYLKSLEIEEKINQVQWVPHHTGTQLILSTNDKTIKLWKVGSLQIVKSQLSQGAKRWQTGAVQFCARRDV